MRECLCVLMHAHVCVPFPFEEIEKQKAMMIKYAGQGFFFLSPIF